MDSRRFRDTSDGPVTILRENLSRKMPEDVQNSNDRRVRPRDSREETQNPRERFDTFWKLSLECRSQHVAVHWDWGLMIYENNLQWFWARKHALSMQLQSKHVLRCLLAIPEIRLKLQKIASNYSDWKTCDPSSQLSGWKSLCYAWRPINGTLANRLDPDQTPPRGVWSGSRLFALNTGISINMVIIKLSRHPFY